MATRRGCWEFRKISTADERGSARIGTNFHRGGAEKQGFYNDGTQGESLVPLPPSLYSVILSQMSTVLDSAEVESLVILVEEATRSSKEGVKRFMSPAQGTLRRAINKRHHVIFGRRGSGKSSLLRKAAADLTINPLRPIAYVDLETFKGHTYPDVLFSRLLSALKEFNQWLETAAVHPANKTSFGKSFLVQDPTGGRITENKSHSYLPILRST